MSFAGTTATAIETPRGRACPVSPLGTSERRGAIAWWGAVLFGIVLLTSVFLEPACAQATSGYPRLGMWWPNNHTQSAADRARYDWIELQNTDAHHIAELRALHPDMHILGATNARELNYRLTGYNDSLNVELRSASTDWMLTQVGSRLTAGVTNSATTIPVGDVTKFRSGEMVLCDRELMRVTAVGASSLTVTRGQVTPTAAHAAGARIAAVVSVWDQAIEMDMTAGCPKVDVGYGPETWTDWNARRGHTVVHSAAWNGLLIDCYDPNPSWFVTNGYNRSIDANRDNVADSLDAFTTAWNTGMNAYGNALRAAVGPSIILLSNCGDKNYSLNGNNIETFPQSTTSLSIWKLVVIGPRSSPFASYLEFCANATQPNLTTIQTYNYDGSLPAGWQTGFVPNYQKLRYGLTTALMGDGYFSYEISTDGHGALGLLWFDEYDNAGAGRGYLGQPTGAAYSVGSNVWRRDYQAGIVLTNPDTVAHTVNLGGAFRKIKGKQAPAVNDGSLVTAVTLQAQDGIILLRETGGVQPAAHLPLHRFYNTRTGTHFYTANESEKSNIISNLGATYSYEGLAYYVSSVSPEAIPVYRFYNTRTGTHFYTANGAEKDNVVARLSSVYAYEGVAFYGSATSTGAIPIYRFYNTWTGTHFYTANPTERDSIITNLSHAYAYEGVVYHAWSR